MSFDAEPIRRPEQARNLGMARRVLFHYPILNVGGAEMSSIRLMKALVDRGWEVTLVLTTGGGPMETQLDYRIRVVTLRPRSFGRRFKAANGWFNTVQAIPDLVAYLAVKMIGSVRMLPIVFERYEAAVTLLHGTSTWFIRCIVRAKTRVHWIRNDLGRTYGGDRIVSAIATESQAIDHYVCVSKVVKDSLVRAVPETAHKARVIYNILDAPTMRKRAQGHDDPFPARGRDSLRVLTVCRLSESSKGLVRMARVCRRLLDHGLQFQWFVIGEGSDRLLFESEIAELQLGEHMILLGASDNPFPAYRHCDVVAVLSYYEGLCGVVNEAKIMGKAVVATRCSGVDEQLVHGESGLIVDNDEEAIFSGLSAVLSNSSLRDHLSNASIPHDLANDEAKLDEIESLLVGDCITNGEKSETC